MHPLPWQSRGRGRGRGRGARRGPQQQHARALPRRTWVLGPGVTQYTSIEQLAERFGPFDTRVQVSRFGTVVVGSAVAETHGSRPPPTAQNVLAPTTTSAQNNNFVVYEDQAQDNTNMMAPDNDNQQVLAETSGNSPRKAAAMPRPSTPDKAPATNITAATNSNVWADRPKTPTSAPNWATDSPSKFTMDEKYRNMPNLDVNKDLVESYYDEDAFPAPPGTPETPGKDRFRDYAEATRWDEPLPDDFCRTMDPVYKRAKWAREDAAKAAAAEGVANGQATNTADSVTVPQYTTGPCKKGECNHAHCREMAKEYEEDKVAAKTPAWSPFGAEERGEESEQSHDQNEK